MTNSKQVGIEIRRVQVLEALAPYGIQPSHEQIEKIIVYIRLLLKWNRLMSLTTITDPAEIVARHFGECMFARNLISVENCRLADVGTGAGFPGLALKIICPGIQLDLIESNQKKSVFLSEVVRALDLGAVKVNTARFEEIPVREPLADLVTARALGGFPDLLRWSRNALVKSGSVILWVGGEDITRITNSAGWTWNPPVRIPESQRRFLLVGQYHSGMLETRKG